jgi:preprotein translocase subunit SecD
LLATPDVQKMLAERRAACPKAAGREELQERWTAIARGEPVVTKQGKQKPRVTHPNVKEMLRASELLAKSLGLFVVRHEVKHGGEVVVRAELPANGRDDGT